MSDIILEQWQASASAWLKARGGIGLLWMATGTGKTFTVLDYCMNENLKKVLVFCPSKLKGQWEDEAEVFTGKDNLAKAVSGSPDARLDIWATATDPSCSTIFYIVNYDLLSQDKDLRRMLSVEWDAVVTDECHFLKSPTSKRWKRFTKLRSQRRIAMSATPLPNAKYEIWTMASWLKPNCLRESWWRFKQMDLITHPTIPGMILGIRDERALDKVIQDISYVVPKSVLGLPELDTKIDEVTIEPYEQKLYTQLHDELRLEIDGEERLTVPNVLARLMRLRQLIDDPSALGLEHTGAKEKRLLEIVKSSDKKTIIFTEFAVFAKRLAKALGCGVVRGGADATEDIRTFKNDDSAKVLVSTSAGQYGLNLQVAKRIIHYGLPWNWARVDQRTGRAHRRGQEDVVEEVFLLARGTVDTSMWQLVNKKKLMNESIGSSDLASILDDLPTF